MADPILEPAPAPRRDPVFRWNIGRADREIVARYWYATDAVYVNWGDATPSEVLGVNLSKYHVYAKPGAYWVQIFALGGALLADAQVVVRAQRRPEVALAKDPDQAGGMIASAPAALDGTGIIPLYRVYWDYYDEPSVFDDWWGLAGSTVRRVLAAGLYTARVVDRGTNGWFEEQFQIGSPDLDFTITATGRDAALTVTAGQSKDLIVAWGDGTPTEPVTGTTATHAYPSTVDDTYIVQLAYADGSGTPAIKTVVIPGGSS